MISERLHQLEQARRETLRYTQELSEKKRANEITGIEHQVLLHEKFHGKTPGEILMHIEAQEQKIRMGMREKREKSLAIVITALFVIFALAGALYFDTSPATGYTTANHNAYSSDWRGEQPGKSTLPENKSEADLSTPLPGCPHPGTKDCEP